jgi:hypothetical protein
MREGHHVHVDALLDEVVQLFEESRYLQVESRRGGGGDGDLPHVDHYAIANDAGGVGMDETGRQQVELERLSVNNDGMPRVVASRTASDDVVLTAERVYNLALALVAPLRTCTKCYKNTGREWRNVPSTTVALMLLSLQRRCVARVFHQGRTGLRLTVMHNARLRLRLLLLRMLLLPAALGQRQRSNAAARRRSGGAMPCSPPPHHPSPPPSPSPPSPRTPPFF